KPRWSWTRSPCLEANQRDGQRGGRPTHGKRGKAAHASGRNLVGVGTRGGRAGEGRPGAGGGVVVMVHRSRGALKTGVFGGSRPLQRDTDYRPGGGGRYHPRLVYEAAGAGIGPTAGALRQYAAEAAHRPDYECRRARTYRYRCPGLDGEVVGGQRAGAQAGHCGAAGGHQHVGGSRGQHAVFPVAAVAGVGAGVVAGPDGYLVEGRGRVARVYGGGRGVGGLHKAALAGVGGGGVLHF
nr:hypothetical protein [Tanacetum cinerariifolium]